MYLKRLKLFLIFTHLIKSLNHKKHPPRLVYGSHNVNDSVTQQVILPLNLEVLTPGSLLKLARITPYYKRNKPRVLILGKGPTFAE